MNFQVGDKVVDLYTLQFWDNFYHWEKTVQGMKPMVVTGANKDYFTTDPRIDVNTFKRGFDDYDIKRKVFAQVSGRPWEGHPSTVLMNLTRNGDRFNEHVASVFAKSFHACDRQDEQDIAKLENEIAVLQERLASVRAGKRPMIFDYKTPERDFLNDRMTALKNLFTK
jgi:hypothetical protein